MKLQCVCGKVLTVPDSMQGERIRCKECGKVLTLRASSSTADALPSAAPSAAADDSFAVKGHRRCKKCGRSWPNRDKICTVCGIDMDTGATLYVSLDASGEAQRQRPGDRPGLVKRLLRFIRMKGH